MEADSSNKMLALLKAALEKKPEERESFLREACKGDAELYNKILASLGGGVTGPGLTGMDKPPRTGGAHPDISGGIDGQTISHFRIIKRLGAGGMGVVYRGEDLNLRRTVALKFLLPELTDNEEAKRRFLSEARAASVLDHPNICTVHEVNETEDGLIFICMTYYEGINLGQKMAQAPLSIEESIRVSIEIASGLAKAHAHGIVHRDIKPANVIMTNDGNVKLVDFGLAKIAHSASMLTKTGMTMGTPSFMSPEQIAGKEVAHSTDIWSLGVLLYQLLTQRLPFQAENDVQLIYAIMNYEPVPPVQFNEAIPQELNRLVVQTLNKEADKRPDSMQSIVQELQSIHAEILRNNRPTRIASSEAKTKLLDPVAPPSPITEKVVRQPGIVEEKGNRSVVYSVAAAGVLVILLMVLYFGQSGKSSESSGERGTMPVPDKEELVVSEKTPVQVREEPADAGQTLDLPDATSEQTTPSGHARITSEPAGATVYFDGELAGTTPLDNFSANPGTHEFRFKLSGREEVVRRLTIESGESVVVHAAFDGRLGSIDVRSKPAGATVILDGAPQGKTPLLLTDVTEGQHKVVLRKAGFQDVARQLNLKAGDTKQLPVTLSALNGRLKVLVQPYGSIYIDGKLHRENQDFQYQVDLPAGKHTVRVQHPTFGVWQREVVINSGREADLQIDFSKSVRLTIASQPTWGEVYVDGKRIGETPREVMFRVGQHEVEVRREGYTTVGGKVLVDIDGSKREPLLFELRKGQP